MVSHNASTRAVNNRRRKYTPKEEEFLGVNIQGRIVSVPALIKMLRKIDDFCLRHGFSSQLFVEFCDGGDCVASGIDEVTEFLHKEAFNIERLSLYYEKTGETGQYVVKSTTLAALKCEVTDEKMSVSAHSTDRAVADFTTLHADLKKTIDHLPKKFDKLVRDRYISVIKIGAALGLVASLLVTALPMLDVRGREYYLAHGVVYLSINLLMTVVLGAIIAIIFVIPLYVELLSGEQKEESCDVAIGKKIHFARYRKILASLDNICGYVLIGAFILLLLMPIIMLWAF